MTRTDMERPAQPELSDRQNAIREAYERQQLEKRERELGIA